MITEDVSKLRTIENYESHLEIISESEKVIFAETKGVKRNCALNKLNYFHMLRNKSVDIMHDLNEGCIPFLLKHLFNYCILKKVFTEDWLQKHVQFFDFGAYSKNVPSLINIKKDNLNQNASQLIFLFRNIGYIFYQMRENLTVKKVWECVESLQNVVQICYSTEISETNVQFLQQNVEKHLKSILEILHVDLIPKHHFLLHYASIIREMGPVIHMSMIRYESKHKSLKNIAKRGNNFINITKTISVRSQAELVFQGFTYCDEIDCGKISRKNLSLFNELEQHVVAQIVENNNILCEIEWFKCNNFTYRRNFAVLFENQFHEINRILVVDDRYYLLCSSFYFEQSDSFTHSLILKKKNSVNTCTHLFS